MEILLLITTVLVGGFDEARGPRTADRYLRVGNSTRRLLTDEVIEYQTRRRPG